MRCTLVVVVLLTSIFFCPHDSAYGADLPLVVNEYSLKSWGPQEGLPSGGVWAVTQDTEGFLWLGTDNGPLRFDGTRFRPWSFISSSPLPDSPVRAIRASHDGSLWFGFGKTGGVTRLKNGDVKTYGPDEGLDAAAVTVFFEHPGGSFWVGTERGLYWFDDDRWKRVAGLSGTVLSTFVDARGRFLVGTTTGVFSRTKDENAFRAVDDLSGRIRDITEDRSGTIWVTDPLSGFRPLHSQRSPSDERGRGYELLHDRRGNFWVGTSGQGLWRVRFAGPGDRPRIDKVSGLIGLSSDWVTALLEDREGNLWIGTYDGLNRLTPYRFTPLTNLGLVSAVETTLDGSIWVGAGDTLVRFPEGRIDRSEATLQLPAPLTMMYCDERGTLWISTDGHLFHLRNSKLTEVKAPGSSLQIVSMTSDARGGLWVYDAERGLGRLNKGRFDGKSLPSNVKDVRVVFSYTDRSGRVWLTLANGHVAVIHHDGAIRVHGPPDGLDAGVYRAIYEDRRGIIWLGGSEGLSRLAGERFSTLRGADGFPLKSVTSIVEDDAQHFWFGNEGLGILRIYRGELDAVFSDANHLVRYTTYDKLDGFAFAGTPRWYGSRAAVRSQLGPLWFVTGVGLTIVDPVAEARRRVAPISVRIERALVDRREVDRIPRAVLPKRPSTVEIEYAALNLTSPLKTRFRYRLEGFDSDWVEAGAEQQAVYSNLPPRAYRFHVSGSASGGLWSESEAVWEFSIPPVFYQTRTFAVVAVTTVVLVLGTAWRIRVGQVRRQFALLFAERVRLSREIHDTLLQGLVGLTLQFDALACDFDSSTTSPKERIIQMRRNVEDYIREARQAIWDLRSPRLLKGDLASALRRVCAQATSEDVTCELQVQGPQRRGLLNVDEQLLRICQEAVINAIRHANARQIRVELQYGERALKLRVVDQGRGFDPANGFTVFGHYGLLNMKERADSIGAEFNVFSEIGRGTVIQAVVPLCSHD